MASEMTGSTLPMRVAHPDAAPLLSRSKLGMSIDGIPSLRGPPDLISSRGTVCCEKSVWGHSARQLNGSAMALPTVIAARAPTAATISIEADFDSKRRALGVDDGLKDVPAVTTRMLVA